MNPRVRRRGKTIQQAHGATTESRSWQREESSNNGLATHSASDNTKSEHAMLAATARTTQTLAARATSRRTKNQTVAFRRHGPLRASQGGFRTRGGRLGGVHALGRQRRRCGRVRAAWALGLCVQSSVMSALLEIRIDNYHIGMC